MSDEGSVEGAALDVAFKTCLRSTQERGKSRSQIADGARPAPVGERVFERCERLDGDRRQGSTSSSSASDARASSSSVPSRGRLRVTGAFIACCLSSGPRSGQPARLPDARGVALGGECRRRHARESRSSRRSPQEARPARRDACARSGRGCGPVSGVTVSHGADPYPWWYAMACGSKRARHPRPRRRRNRSVSSEYRKNPSSRPPTSSSAARRISTHDPDSQSGVAGRV